MNTITVSRQKDTPVRYVLYSHYGTYEGADKAAFDRGQPPAQLEGVVHFARHLRSLKELLTTPGHEGMLVLFYYAPGLSDFMQGVQSGNCRQKMLDSSTDLSFANCVAQHVVQILKQNELQDRVRFVTPIDLEVVFGHAHSYLAEAFQSYFLGRGNAIRYDVPKIVESIIRVRLLGNGVPVLRLDSDVLFRFLAPKKTLSDLGLFKAVACACRAYRLRMEDQTVSTFLFSSSYSTRALREKDPEVDVFEAWSRAFATRVQPALLADPSKILDIMRMSAGEQEKAWDDYVVKHLDESLVRQFYGLVSDIERLEADGVNGITEIGAHPFFAVISGALLCISEGAILDLPPFSNFRNNVMWIDDHLKYSLHRALNHFTSGETLNLEPGLSDARLDDVHVTKARPGVKNLPAYVFNIYLPTLLWGAIMDAWITANPILKCRYDPLKPAEQERWRNARAAELSAFLPNAIHEALQSGEFKKTMRQDKLREDLRTSAVQRIERVRQLWSNLQRHGRKTFACYWAERSVKTHFSGLFSGLPHGLWEGLSCSRIDSLDDLPGPIAEGVRDLIEDAVTYVHWVLDWPKFIQIVRSAPQGKFRGDMSWKMAEDESQERG